MGQLPSSSGTLESYQIGKPLGQGAYAVVYVCYHKASMKKLAIKIYQKSKLNDSMKRKAVQREILIASRPAMLVPIASAQIVDPVNQAVSLPLKQRQRNLVQV